MIFSFFISPSFFFTVYFFNFSAQSDRILDEIKATKRSKLYYLPQTYSYVYMRALSKELTPLLKTIEYGPATILILLIFSDKNELQRKKYLEELISTTKWLFTENYELLEDDDELSYPINLITKILKKKKLWKKKFQSKIVLK